MKTTEAERAFYSPLHKSCCDDAPKCGAPTCQGCSMPWPCLVSRLLTDVNDAVKWLRQQHEALSPNKNLPHSLCGVCDFLKEPKR